MDILNEYLIEEALIVIPVLLIFGKIIKGTPKVKDWLIPYLLLVIGVGFTIALIGLSPDAILQGVLVAGGAVFGHQLVKQIKERD